jgi:hypothetical protein
MSNLIEQGETEMDSIINLELIIPILDILDDDEKTDYEISLDSKEKNPKIPPICQPSAIWQHYEKIFENNILVNIKCNYCNQKYSSKTSTSTLNDHWNRKHSKIQPGGIGSIETAFQNQIHVKSKEEERLENLDNFTNWIIGDCQPFRIVEGLFFKKFIAGLNSGFQVPSQQFLRKKVDNKFEQYKSIIVKIFQVSCY